MGAGHGAGLQASRFAESLRSSPVLSLLDRQRWGRQARRRPARSPRPTSTGVSMGHLHYTGARRRGQPRRFWTVARRPRPVHGRVALGRARPRSPPLPGRARGARASGDAVRVGPEGSVVNHVAFRVPSLAPVEAAGLVPCAAGAVRRRVLGHARPKNERIELFENVGDQPHVHARRRARRIAVADRHNRPLAVPIAFHHVHLYPPDRRRVEAKAWYARCLAASLKAGHNTTPPTCRASTSTSAAPRPERGSDQGRMLDHVGFEVVRLRRLLRRPRGHGRRVRRGATRKGGDGIGRASSPIRGAPRSS